MINVKQKTSSSSSGFTLIEVMVAMVITLVGLLGLLQSVNLATEHNIKNALRDEAVQVGEDYLSDLRGRPLANISGVRIVPSRLRGNQKSFVVTQSTNVMSNSNARELIVRVSWSYKNVSSHHEVRTIRSY